ncbi:MAG: hypothetical protein JO360_14640 [Acidobacteria bacterium]|nr:hypothetical protein [Acidobacteriota bacterium]
MYCERCGMMTDAATGICPTCAPASVPPGPTAAFQRPPSELSTKVKTASKDAKEAFKTFATNPVGGLPVAFESLGPSRAIGVGIVFGGVSILCMFLGIYISLPSFIRPDFGDSLKFFFFGAVPFVSILLASAGTRKVFGGAGSIGGDSLIAGASLLPLGFLVLISGVLGLANVEIWVFLFAFVLCYTILMLYTGCTRISGVAESKAAFAVPVMIILSGWLTKIIFGAMLPSFMPSPTKLLPF